jgi:bacillithiol biosynthesis cysteine-adding enzyme BshC
VRLARWLCERGTPAVPVFWHATEDHDFAEVNHAWIYDEQARPVRIDATANAAADQPVGSIVLTDTQVETLCKTLEPLAFGEDVCGLVREAYVPGRTMGEAFRVLLESLLARFGLLFLDPLNPAIRELAAPLLREAISAAPDLNGRLLERNHELQGAGYHAQVHVEPATSLFFVLDGERRIALKRQNGHYVARDRRYTAGDLAAMAEHLSPNAVLRPVVQDYLLPTAAYVGGPAELAYLAQSQVIYEALLGGMPRLVPRAGFTLIDRRGARLMDRYRVRVEDFFAGEESLQAHIARRLVPPSLTDDFNRADSEVRSLVGQLEEKIGAFDPTLGAAAEKSRTKILYQLERLHGKVARETMRRNARAAADAAYLYNSIFPHKHLQERFYSILPFLARHGFELVDQLYENVHLDCPDHMILRLDS